MNNSKYADYLLWGFHTTSTFAHGRPGAVALSGSDPRQEARGLLESGEVCLLHLWILYWGQGGSADEMELDAFISGIPLLNSTEVAILGWALEPLLSD